MSEPGARSSVVRAAMTIVAITATIMVATHYAFQLERAGTKAFWIAAIAPVSILAVLALVRGHFAGDLKTWMRPAWGDFTRGIFGAAVVFVVAYFVSRAWMGTPRESWLARLYLQLGDQR